MPFPKSNPSARRLSALKSQSPNLPTPPTEAGVFLPLGLFENCEPYPATNHFTPSPSNESTVTPAPTPFADKPVRIQLWCANLQTLKIDFSEATIASFSQHATTQPQCLLMHGTSPCGHWPGSPDFHGPIALHHAGHAAPLDLGSFSPWGPRLRTGHAHGSCRCSPSCWCSQKAASNAFRRCSPRGAASRLHSVTPYLKRRHG